MSPTARIILILLAVLIYKTSEGQGGLPHLVIKDHASGEPVRQAHVHLTDQGGFILSDAEGMVPLAGRSFPLRVKITHVAYEEQELTLQREDFHPEKGLLLISMVPRVVMLDPVEVKRQVPEVVYQRDDLHVGAYHVNSDGLWVLVYDRPRLWHRQEHAGQQVLRGARLFLLDTLFGERASITFPGNVRALHRDHAHRVIVEGEKVAWLAEAKGDAIGLGTIDLDTLHRAVLPWTGQVNGKLLGSDLDATYPAFSHIALDQRTGEMAEICSVEDEHLMRLFRAQYKYMSGRDKVVAMDLELETGIDREIIAGYMTQFHRDILFRVPYAPLFVVNDTIHVFDHYREKVRHFNADLTPIGEAEISHHKERSWRKELLQDPTDGSIYSLHAKNSRSFLRKIDPATGRMSAAFELTHPFPEEVKVYGGHVWYVYRPYGSTQHRTLYREWIR